jgi:mono/diheme cytochrome c family protein
MIAVLGALIVSSAPARAEDGKAVYEATCTNCHGPEGKADTKKGKALKAKSFVGDENLRGTPAEVAAFVAKSVREKKKHKQITKKVDDAQLAAVAEYVRLLATGGGN